jgi:hypothetical protein
MDKQFIIRFLKEKRRGVYASIAMTYVDVVTSMSSKMAMQIIKEDLERVSGEPVHLNYFTFAHAIARFKRNLPVEQENGKRKWDFKDAYETKSSQLRPGEFNVDK